MSEDAPSDTMSNDPSTESISGTGSNWGSSDVSAEERYRKVFEHSNDAVMLVDLEMETFLDANPAACDLLGYARAELLSMAPEDIHPDDVERIREEFLAQVHEEGSGFTDDLTCLTKDGEEVPTEISGAALDTTEGDEPTRMIAMLRDVSDRVEHRRELERTIDRLDRFAGVVSHDLRSPLSVIRGRATLARETGAPEHFDAIEDALDRMDGMLSELLELTREGEVIGDRTRVDLETLARRVWKDCGIDAATLEIESSTTLRADRDRTHELFANLLENAVTHGGPSVTVRVGTLPVEGGFYVEDDGDGIPAEERDAVVEWGHTTSADGTGFGLAIVAEIVEAHGWEIRITESDSGGARFEIAGV